MMSLNNVLRRIVLLLISFEMINGLRITFTNATFEQNSVYGNIRHMLKKKEDGMIIAEFRADLYKYIKGPVYVEGQISALTETGDYEVILKSEQSNYCEVEENISKYPMIEEGIVELKKRGNITIGCPVTVGHYYLNDFYIPDDAIPSFAPPGKYRTDIQVTLDDGDLKDVSVFNTSWYSTLE